MIYHPIARLKQAGFPEETYTRLVTFVPDRPGHDRRYALDSAKLCCMIGLGSRGWKSVPAATADCADHSSDNSLPRLVRWLVVERQLRDIGSDSLPYVDQTSQKGE
jgi:hypothetical protein